MKSLILMLVVVGLSGCSSAHFPKQTVYCVRVSGDPVGELNVCCNNINFDSFCGPTLSNCDTEVDEILCAKNVAKRQK